MPKLKYLRKWKRYSIGRYQYVFIPVTPFGQGASILKGKVSRSVYKNKGWYAVALGMDLGVYPTLRLAKSAVENWVRRRGR